MVETRKIRRLSILLRKTVWVGRNDLKILGTGLSGMVGGYIVQKLESSWTFENLSLETGVDITNVETVDEYFRKSDASWVLHCAALTDVDAAEKEKELGVTSKTWMVNVGATENLVYACKKYQKRLLYISTDFVFPGGEKLYTEEDIPNPIGWYATTKYEGEKRVKELGSDGLIVRISFPYGAISGPKKDFVGKIKERLEQRLPVTSPTDQVFVPTYLEDIANGIQLLIEQNASGIYHLVGGGSISSYDAAGEIAGAFGLDTSLIQKTTAAAFYAGRAPRAFHLSISNAKIAELGLKPVDFQAGLRKMIQKI